MPYRDRSKLAYCREWKRRQSAAAPRPRCCDCGEVITDRPRSAKRCWGCRKKAHAVRKRDAYRHSAKAGPVARARAALDNVWREPAAAAAVPAAPAARRLVVEGVEYSVTWNGR